MNKKINSKITRFGYIIEKKSMSEDELVSLKKELTVSPIKFGNYGRKKDDSFPLYVENGNYINIPKYIGIEKYGMPAINKLDTYKFPTNHMKYKGLLRPNQQIIVNKILENFKTTKGGIVIAGCGSGKTNMAIYIACALQLKTLFVVHKGFLKSQARDRILNNTNVKSVGLIQQDKIDTNHPFVIGMIQSLCKRDYDDEIFKDFGLVIIDEVHHMGAKNFCNFFKKVTTKYMLGISADKTRNDGLFKIINNYMGPIIHAEEQKPNDMVIVKKIMFSTANHERIKVIKNKFTGDSDTSTMVSNLMYIKKRNRLIVKLIEEAFDMGKNILVLSERIKHINIIERLLNENKYIKGSVGLYVGQMTDPQLKESSTKQIILGTYQMAQEGLDIENLNLLIMTTPKRSIKQSVGRILRKDIYEEHPIVIDIIDEDNEKFLNQSMARTKYFIGQQYNLQTFRFADYEKKGYCQWDNLDDIKQAMNKVPVKKNNQPTSNRWQQQDLNLVDFVD